MPRNGSGVYALPAGSTVANGDTSDATDVNTPLADLASDANTARPIVAGGTGATSASAARTALGLAIGSDVQAYNAGLAALAGQVTGLTGADANAVTGTAGTDGNLAQWNADGDIVDGPDVLDEDDMASNSADAVPTQQSTKAYVDGLALGVGQTWQDVSASRAVSTSYQNTTGRPIQVLIAHFNSFSGRTIQVSSDNSNWITLHTLSTSGITTTTSFTVPDTWYYRTNGGSLTITEWVELR